MMVSTCLPITLTLLLVAHPSSAAKKWMNWPYDDESDFNVDAKYKEDVLLPCEDDYMKSKNSSTFTPYYWILPDTTVMMPGNEIVFDTAKDGEAGWLVADNVSMMVTNVQERHFGFYYCVVNETELDELHVVKAALNFEGAYFGDLWDLYRENTIIGCSAAGGFLVACLACYFTYYFVFDKKSEDLGLEDDKHQEGHLAGTNTEHLPGTKGEEMQGSFEVIQTEL